MSDLENKPSLSKKDKTVVLLSAGLDSSVNLFAAFSKTELKLALTFDYGQRAAKREIAASASLCKFLGVAHRVVQLPFFTEFSRSALTNRNAKLPIGESVDINNLAISFETAKAVWVPNRNGIFFNIAAAYAEAISAQFVVPGFNAEEAKTFSDNTQGFLNSLDDSFSFSTANRVKTFCFTTDMNKSEIVQLGRDLNVPFEELWPCYDEQESICRNCESCQRFLNAMGGRM